MDRDLLRKLEDERSLTPDEWLRLDEALESGAAQTARVMVSTLANDQPSMAWRSELNVKLAQTSKRARQRRTMMRWLPVMAAPVAAGCAFLVMMNINASPNGGQTMVSRPPMQTSHESLEARMMDFHRDAMTPLAVGANLPYEASSMPELPESQF